MTLDPRAVTTDSAPLGGDAGHLPARGFPRHRSVHSHPKARAREGLGVREGHPRPGDSAGPGRPGRLRAPPGRQWASPIRPASCHLNTASRGRPVPSALTSDHLGHQPGPRALPAHDSKASGRRGGGRAGPGGQGTTRPAADGGGAATTPPKFKKQSLKGRAPAGGAESAPGHRLHRIAGRHPGSSKLLEGPRRARPPPPGAG